MKKYFLFIIFTGFVAYPGLLFGQAQISGLAEVVQVEGDKVPALNDQIGIDRNLRKDSPFNPIRLITFLDAEFEKWEAHSEILFDDDAVAPRLEGAWIVLHLNEAKTFNLQVGKLPPNFSIYTSRRHSDVNPVVGNPLMIHYKTVLPQGGSPLPGNADALISLRDGRKSKSAVAFGPVFYETCWDRGVEIFGSYRWLDYSVAATLASLSNPKADSNRGKQVVGRIGAHLNDQATVGFSGAYAPYLDGGTQGIPAGRSPEDYKQTAFGFDIQWKKEPVEFVSEGIYSRFEVPYVPEKKLEVHSAYGEMKVNFQPMYVAVRADRMIFSNVKLSSGSQTAWDYNLSRLEVALGYAVNKNYRVKLDWQGNFYDQDQLSKISLYALQFSANL